MAPRNLSAVRGKGFKHVRARLLSALHVGKLRPGDRVPSVRRLADLTGINHKTVHRAYTALAKEGILEVRPGSGTFVGERRSSPGDQSRLPGLSQVIERCRLEAGQLGLSPETYSHFVSICLADGLGGLPVGVIECNWEQITIIGRERGDLHRHARSGIPSPVAGPRSRGRYRHGAAGSSLRSGTQTFVDPARGQRRKRAEDPIRRGTRSATGPAFGLQRNLGPLLAGPPVIEVPGNPASSAAPGTGVERRFGCPGIPACRARARPDAARGRFETSHRKDLGAGDLTRPAWAKGTPAVRSNKCSHFRD